jgi:hypothetical protein
MECTAAGDRPILKWKGLLHRQTYKSRPPRNLAAPDWQQRQALPVAPPSWNKLDDYFKSDALETQQPQPPGNLLAAIEPTP